MSSFADIKQEVATQLGKKDYGTPDIIRDTAIIRARRKFYKEYPWSYLTKQATLTFTNGIAPYPLDMEDAFEPQVFSYDGTIKTPYQLVSLADVSGYDVSYPVVAVDYGNKEFKSNLSVIPTITYQSRPNVSPADVDIEPIDDISAIVALGIANYWLAKERNDDMFKLFSQTYEAERSRLIIEDRLKEPVRRFKPDVTNYGYQV